jgi:predicted DCC family thiol-disulfide oxidoreductase YuxK
VRGFAAERLTLALPGRLRAQPSDILRPSLGRGWGWGIAMFEPTPFSPTSRHGVIIYDGRCDMCTRSVGQRYRFFEKHGFAVVSLQTPGVPEYAHRDIDTLMSAIHLVMSDGRIFVGVDCFRRVLACIWWLKPVSWVLCVPVVHAIAVRVYAAVAKRRHRSACPMKKNKGV